MKFVIVLACLIAVAVAAPAESEVLKNESTVGETGFHYAYETSDGISASEDGELKGAGSEDAAVVVHGEFSYTSPEGKNIHVTYTADETGYHPTVA